MKHKILIVDDDDAIREELLEHLGHKGYTCHEASGVGPALESLHKNPDIAIILTDIRMPGRDGTELIATARDEFERDLEFIIMTGHGGTEEAIKALRLGAQDFLEKPINLRHLHHVVERANRLLLLRNSERLLKESLVAEVGAKTVEVKTLLDDLQTAYEEALDLLALAAEYKDPETGNHIRRIGAYSRHIVAELGWSQKRQELIELAAPLHDIGKIGTPDAVLLKPGKLTPDEITIMEQHTEIGHRILSRSTHPVIRLAANIAWAHHEHWDGSGYPRGLKAGEIPVEARIIAFSDIYDALRSKRPYKPAFSHKKALGIMLEGDGRTMPGHFDPELLETFRHNSDAFANIYAKFTD